ncbi:MAG TPA: SGNH/GDSL hydrolase family protein [Candidatus Tectomicrobia bacterium]|nr:SGNH/GDSL hydrolase family protein [Candidatus Tectomicrobia bacterium]
MKIRTLLACVAMAVECSITTSSALAGGADLSRLVVVGDSLSAGYQNGSLLGTQQPHGYANLVAAQAGVELPLPLIAAPGIPPVLQLVATTPLPIVVPAPGTSTGRIDPLVQAMNLAVPGATVGAALRDRPDFPIDDLSDIVLGLPGLLSGVSRSQVEWAEALAPTTVIAWIGSMDALGALLVGDASAITPVADFERDYAELVDRLAATGATLVVANIPDVTAIPYLVPAAAVAGAIGLPLDAAAAVLGIGPDDFVTLDAFPAIQDILFGVTPRPLDPRYVLDPGDIQAIRSATAAFNAIIAANADRVGAAVVDVHGLFERLRVEGLVVNGQRLHVGYLGGLFSLDGIHPTNTGYAVLANEFIHALDTAFAATVPPLAVVEVADVDPLVLPDVGRPAGLGHVHAQAGRWQRAVLSGKAESSR